MFILFSRVRDSFIAIKNDLWVYSIGLCHVSAELSVYIKIHFVVKINRTTAAELEIVQYAAL